jgi:hypothetical protein
MDLLKINTIGAFVAIFIISMSIFIFVFRLLNKPILEYWTGIIFILTAFPLIYLLVWAIKLERPTLYYIQIGTILTFIVAELLLDYVLKIEFRNIKWVTILYVMLFFAGTGGMIGIASQAGRIWSITSVILFFIMTGLAFYQRAKSGT